MALFPDRFYFASLRDRLGRRLNRPGFFIYATLGLMLLGWVSGQRLSEHAGLAHLEALANERLELYASNLEAELGRHAYLPSLLAIDDQLLALLKTPQDTALRRQAAQTLARVNVRAGTMQILVTDARARVLAASDASPAPDGLQAAIDADVRHFFASDAASRGTDFYLLQPVRQQEALLGVIVVRLSLAPLEATWVDLGLRTQGERLLVADEQDVIIMSSVPYWKYFVLGQADEDRRQALRASGRYPASPFTSVGVAQRLLSGTNASLLRVPPLENKPRLIEGPLLLAQERLMVPLGLRMVALSDPTEVWRQARNAGWSGAAFGACLGLLALYLASRRRALRQLFQAKAELQQAHGQLERVVDMRTAELRSANAELKRQIAQRIQAEDELVQAGKLAALGQMSAGISHEVNQPLTALRALARNSQLLLEGGRQQAVAENLRIMDQMVERMGQITRQLKNFARRAELLAAPISLLDAAHNALLLVQHRLREEQVELQLEVPPGLRVHCEGNRLEQVLVNLLGNALDAMKGEPERRLRVAAEPLGKDRVLVRVADSGRGLDAALQPRLFEPFFTTKPAGEGLGLGLVISSKIVHEFGGTLRAVPQPQGMAFEFDLAVVTWEAVEEESQHV
ncbi:sensor histidine kinase [Roseateles sp. DAIF2]|uniref:sensor histidine kinase n=1 Tax=Roseateles sp. DAIF2 TaxID=2714952 RepID=UPI0018A30739|nr:ATP-binding protein [Roseateles sp. DAIF2]QPF73230.1 sensor histidine kinase [Roseateles sp. DAIF2]